MESRPCCDLHKPTREDLPLELFARGKNYSLGHLFLTVEWRKGTTGGIDGKGRRKRKGKGRGPGSGQEGRKGSVRKEDYGCRGVGAKHGKGRLRDIKGTWILRAIKKREKP